MVHNKLTGYAAMHACTHAQIEKMLQEKQINKHTNPVTICLKIC